MSEKEQIEALAGELQKVIDRSRKEFQLTVASAVGCLEIVKACVLKRAFDEEDE